jgi:hypothetical protein
MKKIISLTLAALILVTLLLTATSCELSMESVTGYTRLRDHVVDTVGNNGELELNGSALGFKSVKLIAPIMKGEDRANAVYLVAEGVSGQNLVRLTLTLVDSTEKATMGYQIISPIEQKRIVGAQCPGADHDRINSVAHPAGRPAGCGGRYPPRRARIVADATIKRHSDFHRHERQTGSDMLGERRQQHLGV